MAEGPFVPEVRGRGDRPVKFVLDRFAGGVDLRGGQVASPRIAGIGGGADGGVPSMYRSSPFGDPGFRRRGCQASCRRVNR
jgi:hypothetical protein